ncbi:P-loop containing nucleoside triphosphate hydrolase protein [Lojkania enalia]|uniref:P-loop containing nucleoside triphosphate hydrolase protein n=1 Tax=Lojkania enalia TaxID=147567 RepID=A0A9P4KD79_9PLEO|nr:P-loop containing nucleoside triphosphate hydrolase protein [Didymosphaeria enalia]
MSRLSGATIEQEKKLPKKDEEDGLTRRAGWKTLFGFTTKRHLPVLSLAVTMAAIAALTLPAMAILYGILFRQFADYGSGKINGTALLRNASKYCLYMTGIAAINWLTNSLYFILFLIFGELQARSARERIFNTLVRRDMEWYDTRQNGIAALLSTIQMQIRDLQLSTSTPLGEGLQCVISGLGALIVAFYFSWNLTIVIICTVPLVYLVMGLLSRRLSKRAHEQADKLQQALKYVTNAVQSIETVKCFNGERLELLKFVKVISHAASLYKRQANLRSFQIGFMQFIISAIFVQGFWYGSYLVTSGKTDAGHVVITFWGALMAVQGLTGFVPQLIVLQKGKVAGARLRGIMMQTSRLDKSLESQGGEKPDNCPGDVEFQHVSFTYPTRPNQTALNDISLFFPAGDTTFVIGRSGSGKSTLGQLLVRFYSPSSGQIRIDRAPLQSLDTQWLRDNVTLVEQHSVLFNDTIRRNIALVKRNEEPTAEQLKEAVSFALLDQMIKDLPNGLDTLVGTKGNSLSGGQRQRMALARARLRNTPVLVLDESTSALDNITRSAMLQAIRRWRLGKTTIVITHDISQILPNDFVYILENSKVIQEGYRKMIENVPNSAFNTFLDIDTRRPEEDEEMLEDETDEIFSLYHESWGQAPHPLSGVFGEPYVLPLMSPRHSLLMSGPKRASVMASELGKRPPSIIRPLEDNDTFHPLPFPTRRGSLVSTRQSLLSQDVPIQLDLLRANSSRQRMSLKEGKRSSQTSAQSTLPSATQTLSIKQIMKTVWPVLDWRSRVTFTGAIICAAIHAGATPTFAFVFARLLSTFYVTAHQTQMALKYALSILGIAILDGSASYGQSYFFDSCAQTWANALKQEAMRRILLQPKEFFDREENSVSQLAECIDHCAEEARNLPGRFASIVLVVVIMVNIAIIWSLVICWKLTLVALASGLVLFASTRCYHAISSRWETYSNEADEKVGQVLYETFVNIRTVRCFVLEEVFRKRYKDATTNALKVGVKRAVYTGSIFGINYACMFFVTTFLFWYGATIVASREFSTTRIIEVFGILLLSVNQVNYIGNYIPQVNIAKDAGSRLMRLSGLPLTSPEHSGTMLIHSAGDIVLRNVYFSYPTRKDLSVLQDVSFCIPRGSCTAIVGPSGSGKSTIAALLFKLYQTNSGAHAPFTSDLTVSGHDIKTLHTATLRSRMAIVSQTPVLFPGTIVENIVYGLPPSSSRATIDGVRAAAVAAGVSDFIDSLPLGYQTVVGEGGTGLSGGQAQRIAIARALVRSPDILILDEATSALDVESAGVIRDTIQRLVMDGSKEGGHRPPLGQEFSCSSLHEERRDMTVIIITHAREMMAIAEHIIVLDKGRVVEEGTYDALRRRQGPFARLLRGEKTGSPERGGLRK